MRFYIIMLAFALLFSGSVFSFCIGQVCLFDKGGLAYVQQSAPVAFSSMKDAPAILTPSLTVITPVPNCEKAISKDKYTLVKFSLNNIDWGVATCILVIDGKETDVKTFFPLMGTHDVNDSVTYRTSDDNKYGCGQHTVSVQCFNNLNKSKATQIVNSSNSGTFTCTNCCAGTAPISNLICKDDCSTLTPPQYKKYSCATASCSCQLSDFNVTCSSGVGNASGALCINDCNAQTQYCDGRCICRPKQNVACSAGTGITNPVTQSCTNDCNPASAYCDSECVCKPKQQVSCVSGIGITNPATQVCKDDCSTLGYTCESSCSCWPDMKITAETSGCEPSGSNIKSTFTFSVAPPPAAGDSYDCKVKIDGVSYAYATIKAGQTSGVATTYLPVKQGSAWTVECTYKGRTYVSTNSPSYSCTVGCASGVGNATGAICRNDCSGGYTCISNCTCKLDDVPTVNCSAGTGNASGQLCINDCNAKLGADYFCDGQCKCQKSPPETVKCSSGIGNASGQICQNDCTIGFVCNKGCKCEKLPTVAYCSAGSYSGIGLCMDDCAGALGKDFECDVPSCTCSRTGAGSGIISSSIVSK